MPSSFIQMYHFPFVFFLLTQTFIIPLSFSFRHVVGISCLTFLVAITKTVFCILQFITFLTPFALFFTLVNPWIFYTCLVFHISGHSSYSKFLHLLYSNPEHTIPLLIYHIKGTSSTAVTEFVLLVSFYASIPLTSPNPRLQYLSLEINLRIECNKYGGSSSGRN